MQKNDEKKMQFILSVRSKGVVDDNVLKAIESLNREHFLKGVFAQRAYEDTPLPIECGQTISKPSVVGIMTQALKITTRDKILEIGTGSGYQTAILSKLARRVYSVERFKPLYDEARQIFKQLNLNNITPIWGDGSQGIVEQQPFDRIIVTAAAEDPPPILLNQLKVGGIMIIPVGQSDEIQKLIKVERTETNFKYEDLCDVRFVPLLEGREDGIYV
ncbi:MAG: protein-L-isoaspartate(D-aspartate) O-methyltransferase [Paracoccaceae bacterium]|jgi:protein-L-isoaspartate(D-aspartate) O-methyltransferase|tara:strand:- start:1562 stop:2212 length:651 start_codon:yes stop_codon:yes gene_type:complete